MKAELVWTIASIWVLGTERVQLIGEFPTQQKCIKVAQESPSGNEMPPQIRQCVQIKKNDLHEYASGGEL